MNDSMDFPKSTPRANAGPTGSASLPGQPAEPLRAPDPTSPTKEGVIWTGRTSWKHFAGSFSLWLVGSIGVIWLAVYFADGKVAFWTSFTPVAAWFCIVVARAAMFVFRTLYRLTDERLFIERGILSRTIDQTELIRVDDVRIHKSFWDRVLGLGSIQVLTTDQTDKTIRIEGINTCDQVAEVIRAQMRKLRQRSLFVENL